MTYESILQVISMHSIPYVVIGTWALKKYYPDQLHSYKIHDCDIHIRNSHEDVSRLIVLLKKYGWTVKLWGEEVVNTVSEKELKGKFYLRAEYEALQLDITFENDYMNWSELSTNSVMERDVTYASVETIMFLKRCKGTEKDMKVLNNLI